MNSILTYHKYALHNGTYASPAFKTAKSPVNLPFFIPSEVDKLRRVEEQTGGAINPVMPHVDGWCCNLPTSFL